MVSHFPSTSREVFPRKTLLPPTAFPRKTPLPSKVSRGAPKAFPGAPKTPQGIPRTTLETVFDRFSVPSGVHAKKGRPSPNTAPVDIIEGRTSQERLRNHSEIDLGASRSSVHVCPTILPPFGSTWGCVGIALGSFGRPRVPQEGPRRVWMGCLWRAQHANLVSREPLGPRELI